jgi:excisionase family DNA binding protein
MNPTAEAASVSEEARELRIAAQAVRLYAETHPRPTQVTQQQAAEMLGVSTRTVRRYIRSGLMKLNRSGYLPIEAVDEMRASQ